MAWIRKIGRAIRFVLALVVVGFLLKCILIGLFPYPYRDMIETYAERERLSPHLLAAVIKVESGFNPKAVSSQGARGLMQIMPDTAKWCAQHMGMGPIDVDLLFEPEANVRMGAWYLAHLHDEFGEEIVALAAYNGGKGKVAKWLEDWNGSLEGMSHIPYGETRRFIKRVLASKLAYEIVYGGGPDLSLSEARKYLQIWREWE